MSDYATVPAVSDGRRPFASIAHPQLPVAAVTALVGFLVLTPLGYLLWRTFFDDGGVSLRYVREAYAVDGLGGMAWTSLLFAAGATALAMLIGVPLAWLIVRTDLPLRRTVLAVALLPLVVPGVLYTIAWIFLASPNAGLINSVAGAGTVDVFGLRGMIVVEAFHAVPLVLLLTAAALRSLDTSLEESALTAGASLPTVVRRITLPLLRPALLAAALVSMISALESFDGPALLGIPGDTWVFTARIFQALQRFPDGIALAGAYALPLLALTCAGAVLLASLTRRRRSYETVTGRGARGRPLPLGRSRWPVFAAVSVYVAIAIVLPMLALGWISTQPYLAAPSGDSLGRASLDGYRDVFDSSVTLRAFRNSLLLATAAATTTVAIGAVVAWFSVRSGVRGRRLADATAFLPLALPGLVLGAALLAFWLRAPWTIYGTLWLLLVAYVTRFLPYGLRTASAAMSQLGQDLEDAAHMSGASWWQTFRRVVLPLAGPGLLAGWIMVVVFAMRELSASIVLYAPGQEVLAVAIWNEFQNGSFRSVGALGVVVSVVSLVLDLAATLLFQRFGRQVSRARG